jgi:hypothetical protein
MRDCRLGANAASGESLEDSGLGSSKLLEYKRLELIDPVAALTQGNL